MSYRKSEKALSKQGLSFWENLKRSYRAHKCIYFMLIPVVVYYVIFNYGPMYGLVIAFKDFEPTKGISGSEWVGFEHFVRFFRLSDFKRLMSNTISINIQSLVLGFPAPIIFALLLNEIRKQHFKRVVQTFTYIPHFISLVVMCGIIRDFFSGDGVINQLVATLGLESLPFFTDPKYFQAIYIWTDIWQGFGWGSIIYLAALSGIDPSLYEAAEVDGANRLRRMWHVTLPGIAPTIIIMLILRMGGMMSLGADKIILLYNSSIYETSDVIASYIYRVGIASSVPQYSFTSAVGLFNSLINCVLLVAVNRISRAVSETNLW